MNVASKDLCTELYGLIGWECEENAWITYTDWNRKFPQPPDTVMHRWICDTDYARIVCPAYDLGYLLRMLPGRIGSRGQYAYLRMSKVGKSYAFAYMSPELIWTHENKADTPEDAACRLAIELFKAGVLTKEAIR